MLILEIYLFWTGLTAVLEGGLYLFKGFSSGVGARIAGILLMAPIPVALITGVILGLNTDLFKQQVDGTPVLVKLAIMEAIIVASCVFPAYLIAFLVGFEPARIELESDFKVSGAGELPLMKARPAVSRGQRAAGRRSKEPPFRPLRRNRRSKVPLIVGLSLGGLGLILLIVLAIVLGAKRG